MKKKLLYWTIYLSGCVASFFTIVDAVKRINEDVYHRRFVQVNDLFIIGTATITSWVGCAASGIFLLTRSIDGEKEINL